MTKMVHFTELGGPEVLQVTEVELDPPGAGEVLVDIEAIGLNRSETMFRTGTYIEPTRLPARIGYEAAGTVREVGEDVSRWSAGDPVSVVPAFSMNDYAVCGEQAVVPARSLVPRPVDAVTGAAVWMPFLTVYAGLLEPHIMRPGDTVLITAAASSVGLAAIAVAKRIGAHPIATVRTGEKAQQLLDAGAAHVIVTDESDQVEVVRDITGGRGLDVVFDAVAGPAVEQLAEVMVPGGTIVIHGRLSGAPTTYPTRTMPDLIMRSFTLFGMTYDPERLRRAAAFVVAGLQSGDFTPHVDRVFEGLGSVVAAHRHLESNTQFGKIVLKV
ncbi:zinc-dependent alcohol dehydrogenase family protein [Antrihabitans stalactiti]|uniref:Zinc-binding dehydrogenase n=1 Tax=Antrihabitans stalactiti TaxID=2584121 RepID=A0A848K578_9NOCA|nr:zinc-dependent alcohol dehydrogenase family protein [Antrihabitans stalactiti]NMN93883.1 zinc-binding dehydrogenase [Antrihabitans stalactiti]